MIGPLTYWQWLTVAVVLSICASLLVGPRLRRMSPPPAPPRDLCKRGCGIVHGVICGSGTIIDGLPVHCERAYCHSGRHEAGDDMNFVCWPNRDDPEDAVERTVHGRMYGGPPFEKMIL